MKTLLLIGCIANVHSLQNIAESPIEEHPEILERMKSQSNCSNEQLMAVNEQCTEVVDNLIHIVYEYENGLRNYNPDIPSLTYCERGHIACFSHPIWTAAANCVCSICNHIWFYDAALHERFVSYFEFEHQCPGMIPNRMWKMQFCDFMSQPERKILPKACESEEPSEEIVYFYEETFIANSANIFYTNQALMIWTIILAITMSISMYLWNR